MEPEPTIKLELPLAPTKVQRGPQHAAPPTSIAGWLASRAMTANEELSRAAAGMFKVMLESPNPNDKAAAEEIVHWEGDLTYVVRWLATNFLLARNNVHDGDPAGTMFQSLLDASSASVGDSIRRVLSLDGNQSTIALWLRLRTLTAKDKHRNHGRELIRRMRLSADASEKQAAESIVAWDGDLHSVAKWLSPYLRPNESMRTVAYHSARHSKLLLESMLAGSEPESEAAIPVIVSWIKEFRVSDLRDGDGIHSQRQLHSIAAWGMEVLTKHVIVPLLNAPYRIRRAEDCGRRGRMPEFSWPAARRVSKKVLGHDFADSAPGHIWQVIGKYEEGKDFRDWLHLSLKSHLNQLKAECDSSMSKRQKSKALAGGPLPRRRRRQSPRAGKLEALRRACVLAAATRGPLSEADIAALKTWAAIDGLLVGCDSGLYHRIPSKLWNSWIRECKPRLPLPNSKLLTKKEFKRRGLLASILGVTRNVLDKKWSNIRQSLRQLDCIKEINTRIEGANPQ